LGGEGEARGGAAVGGATAPHRGRPWRRLPAGLCYGSRARPPKPRRRDGDATVASATALMGAPVDAAATAVGAVVGGLGGSSATSPSGGRAAPGAQPPRRPTAPAPNRPSGRRATGGDSGRATAAAAATPHHHGGYDRRGRP